MKYDDEVLRTSKVWCGKMSLTQKQALVFFLEAAWGWYGDFICEGEKMSSRLFSPRILGGLVRVRVCYLLCFYCILQFPLGSNADPYIKNNTNSS